MRKNLWKADLLLFITALIWGGTFVIVKETLKVIHPLQVIAYRFTLAFFFLFALYIKPSLKNWRNDLIPGIFLGSLLSIAFITQTYGLKYSTPSTSAFITGLNVVMVALFESLIFRKRLPYYSIIGVLAATFGLFILTWSGKVEFKIGDSLTLICAVFFALHIVATGRIVVTRDARSLTVYQFGAVSFITWALILPLRARAISGNIQNVIIPSHAWPTIIYLGILATAMAFFFQTTAQRLTTPVHTAVILSTEPAFAALIAVFLGYENLTIKLSIGGLLILIGMISTSTEESFNELQGKII